MKISSTKEYSNQMHQVYVCPHCLNTDSYDVYGESNDSACQVLNGDNND